MSPAPDKPPHHIRTLDELEYISIQVAALTELLGLSLAQYQAAVQRGDVIRKNNKRPLLVPTLRRFFLRMHRTEEMAAANVERIESQISFTRQRQKNEELKMRAREKELIDIQHAVAIANELAISTQQFCEDMITETCRRVAPKSRRTLRAALRERVAEILEKHAQRIADL